MAAGVMLAAGVVALLLGARLVATPGVSWDDVAVDAVEVGGDLAERSQAAAAALTDGLASIKATSSTLGEVSVALESAAFVAADLEVLASDGLASGPDGIERLVSEIDRLAGAIDQVFPGLAALGIANTDGPGDALRAAGAELMTVPDAPASVPAAGFGPFVLQYPLPGFSSSNSFGAERGNGFHGGIDIAAPTGTPILAADDGIVIRSGWLDEAAGNGVILSHEQGWETRYFHMVSADLPISTGDTVAAGQVIGSVGNTGDSTGPHLHFEIVFGPIRMDPEGWFTYIGRGVGSDDPTVNAPRVESPVTNPAPIGGAGDNSSASTEGRPLSEVAGLSDALADIADVQQELLAIGADASDQAAAFEARRIEEQDRTRTAPLAIYGGATAVVLGLLLLWATRPRWPVTQ